MQILQTGILVKNFHVIPPRKLRQQILQPHLLERKSIMPPGNRLLQIHLPHLHALCTHPRLLTGNKVSNVLPLQQPDTAFRQRSSRSLIRINPHIELSTRHPHIKIPR